MQLTSAAIAKKDIRLTRQLSIIALAGSIFYLFYDLFSGAYGYLAVYFILIIGSCISLILIRKNKINLAKANLLIAANVLVTCFGSVETLETGIYFYYILLSIAAFTLYGYKRLRYALIFVFVSIALFVFIFFTEIQLIPIVEISEEYIRGSLLLNFILILISTILIIFYLLHNNYLTESALNKQREDLIKTTKELEKSQRRFELAIQGSSAAIWDWDIIKNTIFATPQLAEIINRPLATLQGVSLAQYVGILHPEDKDIVQEKLDNHLKDKKKFEVECRIRTGTGDYAWVLNTGQAEWDENNKPVRMVGTVVDIHERKYAVDQVKEQNIMLAKANEELDRFVYSTSHDLRAPLSSLLGLINLAGTSTEKSDRDQLIMMMRNQTIKLDSYIQDITDYSRNTRVEVEKEEFKLKDVIEESFSNLRYMEGAASFSFELDIPADYHLYTDKSRFKIIINNIISNAIKYRNPDKTSYLKIRLSNNDNTAILAFEDNGEGVNPQHLNKIFDMFYRASDKSKGSGLGLYIAKETAIKINMDLGVESSLGEGTTFYLYMPLQKD